MNQAAVLKGRRGVTGFLAGAFLCLAASAGIATAQAPEVSPAHLRAEARNPSAFVRKYGGKEVAFRGTVDHIVDDEANDVGLVAFVACATGAPCPEYHCCGAVYCVVSRETVAALKPLQPSLRTRVLAASGTYRRMRGETPAFDQCTIQDLPR